MTLIVAGYWQTTYWAEHYWMQDYWAEYGVPVAAPPAPPRSIDYTRKRIYKTKKPEDLFEDREFLGLLTEFMEII